MLQSVYDMLVLRRLAPRWVADEVYVEVRGRAFAIDEHPHGVAVRDWRADKILAHVYPEPDEAIASLGL
jgi:hypothetical protein